MSGEALSEHSTPALLGQYAAILHELRERGVVRTRNAPLGDYAEFLAQRAYGGELMPNSGKSYDLVDANGARLQVKARTVGAGVRGSAKFSAFRSYDFDAALFIAFDLGTYDVVWARLVDRVEVEATASYSAHINGSSLRIRTAALMGRDATDDVRRATQ